LNINIFSQRYKNDSHHSDRCLCSR
jgi:hypothetical protein